MQRSQSDCRPTIKRSPPTRSRRDWPSVSMNFSQSSSIRVQVFNFKSLGSKINPDQLGIRQFSGPETTAQIKDVFSFSDCTSVRHFLKELIAAQKIEQIVCQNDVQTCAVTNIGPGSDALCKHRA